MKSTSKPQRGELIQPRVRPWDNGIINLQSALEGRIKMSHLTDYLSVYCIIITRILYWIFTGAYPQNGHSLELSAEKMNDA